MATNSQGIVASISGDFGDIDFVEVISVSVDGATADTVEITPRTLNARDKGFRAGDRDHGTASVVMRSASYMNYDFVGTFCHITVIRVASSDVYLDHDAIIQSFAWRASVGELQEYALTFKLGAI